MKTTRPRRSGSSPGRFFLIPWHIGNRGDVTLRALAAVKALKLLVSVDPARLRVQLEKDYSISCQQKRLMPLPQKLSARVVDDVVEALRQGDGGFVSGAGSPFVADAGAQLVRSLRDQGVQVVALPGPSILTTLLSASGVEWEHDDDGGFCFCFFGDHRELPANIRSALERDENVVVLFRQGSLDRFSSLMKAMSEAGFGARQVMAFRDLTRVGGDHVVTRACADWLAAHPTLDWARGADVSVIVRSAKSQIARG